MYVKEKLLQTWESEAEIEFESEEGDTLKETLSK